MFNPEFGSTPYIIAFAKRREPGSKNPSTPIRIKTKIVQLEPVTLANLPPEELLDLLTETVANTIAQNQTSDKGRIDHIDFLLRRFDQEDPKVQQLQEVVAKLKTGADATSANITSLLRILKNPDKPVYLTDRLRSGVNPHHIIDLHKLP